MYHSIPGHGQVEDLEELSKRGLVHDIDHAHVCDEEVEDAASGGCGAILLLSRVDLHLSLCCHMQLLTNLCCSLLSGSQDADHRLIIHQGALEHKQARAFKV